MVQTSSTMVSGGAANAVKDVIEFPVQDVVVEKIRPEEGLARKRDREGHRELQRSIEQFGVLTPITVRMAPDGSGDFLLIKGQGRTLACRLLGLMTVPAIVVDDAYAESEKVQQFLVENVARLKMRPIDRALLIHRAREAGEETSSIASRFGLTPATVRRLFSQLDGASQSEVAALRDGKVNLSRHAAIAHHVAPAERPTVVALVAGSTIRTKELEALFEGLGWSRLGDLGGEFQSQKIALLKWACATLDRLPNSSSIERLRQLAAELPLELTEQDADMTVALA
ncbi:ParB/RepB/Spo0J family partition protein [Cryobacterium sp. TMT2-42-4]|uniref:ParB/RepB/Spo0J family partition protein n=1 Tax=Cryobacterium sp. TMT2-42-4 TaxID=1259255 RepID=UPI00106CAD05|nr:ParB/RepB/Spo0J family partition protein [Cryobacterium sp. TMT2-42-4]TFC34136.1 ParB/RepB/Spo0J family partition protein [Cryobacterium sp. TMT2-42-4]